MTTAFDAKAAMYDKFCASDALADLAADDAIWFGYQPGPRPRECVWVGEIAWDGEVGASLGGNRRDETYRIIVTAEAHMPGDDQRAANDRVKARVTAIEEMLRDVRFLGVAGIFECGVVPQMLGEGADPGGRGAIFVTSVLIRARI